MKKQVVLLGMSGGVDSSVAALLLKKQGYTVIGAFIKSFSDTKNPYTGECAWREERRTAIKIAAKLDIPLYTFDSEKEYKNKVLLPMYNEYKKGKTPNPDIECNKQIKFPVLWEKAKSLGANVIATGHYARIKKNKTDYSLLAGLDKTKDQSYFLYLLNQKDLSHTLFPLGSLTKNEVRNIAKKNKFPNHDQVGSRGICFVGKLNMKSFLEKKIKNKKGKILSPDGIILGTHPGAFYYTIGQRIGPHIGIELIKPKGQEQEKWYVAAKHKNTIIAAPENHTILKKSEIKIKKIHFIYQMKTIPKNLSARIRHLGELHKGSLIKDKNNYSFKFESPVTGLAEGQHIVIYSKDELICGGEIYF